jgi:hypothetical protein
MDLHDGPGTGGPANGREPEEDGPAATKPRASADDASSAGTISVEMRGQTRDLPAGKDYTGDGRPDAVAETPDGQVVVFADTEDNESGAATPDGKADEVYVVDKATGRARPPTSTRTPAPGSTVRIPTVRARRTGPVDPRSSRSSLTPAAPPSL